MSARRAPGRRVSKRTSETRPAPREPRKRYYIFSQDMRTNPSDFRFLNEDEVLINGRTAGRHDHSVPGEFLPFKTGAPPLRGKPKLAVAVAEAPVDIYGFGPYFVSSRAKALLSGLDPDGFDFIECDTVDRDGTPLEPYWMMNAI